MVAVQATQLQTTIQGSEFVYKEAHAEVMYTSLALIVVSFGLVKTNKGVVARVPGKE